MPVKFFIRSWERHLRPNKLYMTSASCWTADIESQTNVFNLSLEDNLTPNSIFLVYVRPGVLPMHVDCLPALRSSLTLITGH